MTGSDPPTVHGVATCLAMLEREARALGKPLAAMLIAAAGEALRDSPSEAAASPRPMVSAPASPRRG